VYIDATSVWAICLLLQTWFCWFVGFFCLLVGWFVGWLVGWLSDEAKRWISVQQLDGFLARWLACDEALRPWGVTGASNRHRVGSALGCTYLHDWASMHGGCI
jgi:hypothetical protein